MEDTNETECAPEPSSPSMEQPQSYLRAAMKPSTVPGIKVTVVATAEQHQTLVEKFSVDGQSIGTVTHHEIESVVSSSWAEDDECFLESVVGAKQQQQQAPPANMQQQQQSRGGWKSVGNNNSNKHSNNSVAPPSATRRRHHRNSGASSGANTSSGHPAQSPSTSGGRFDALLENGSAGKRWR